MAKTPEELKALGQLLREQEQGQYERAASTVDPAKARWDELLRLLRSIDDNIRKVLDAEHQGLETVGVEPRVYIESDTRTLSDVITDAERDNRRPNEGGS
jgi:predicted nuclease with TOPRIM domain